METSPSAFSTSSSTTTAAGNTAIHSAASLLSVLWTNMATLLSSLLLLIIILLMMMASSFTSISANSEPHFIRQLRMRLQQHQQQKDSTTIATTDSQDLLTSSSPPSSSLPKQQESNSKSSSSSSIPTDSSSLETTSTFSSPPETTVSSPLSLTPLALTSSALQWWDDLAPPFRSSTAAATFETETIGLTDPATAAGAGGSNNKDFDSNANIVHFMFLVHGHRGFSRDLSYLHTRMQDFAIVEKQKWNDRQERRRLKQLEKQRMQHIPVSVAVGTTATTTESETGTTTTTVTLDQPEQQQQADQTNPSSPSSFTVSPRPDMVVHSAVSNEKKTADGVKQGGERLVQEMLQVIRQELNKRKSASNSSSNNKQQKQIKDITVSMLGNSLGGIYARYAIAKLTQQCTVVECDDDDINAENDNKVKENNNNSSDHHHCYLLDGEIRIHFNVFCTTATPHLGLADHTFVPLPRTAEIGVAHALGDTGRDLFRLNDLMKEMATTEEYLEPLANFRKRIAYANAYGTDFPVPVHTAAFLSESSQSPHHFVEETPRTTMNDGEYSDDEDEDDGKMVVDEHGFVIATLHTPKRTKNGNPEIPDLFLNQDDTDELVHMSTSLDALGWKKVFIDVRQQIPKIAVPKAILLKSKNNGNKNGDVASSQASSPLASDAFAMNVAAAASASTTVEHPIHLLKSKGVAESKEVAAAVKGSLPLFDDIFHWPLGHNMMVAFSRSRFSSYLNKGGRPVVDLIASELVQDVFGWTNDSYNSNSNTSSIINNNNNGKEVKQIINNTPYKDIKEIIRNHSGKDIKQQIISNNHEVENKQIISNNLNGGNNHEDIPAIKDQQQQWQHRSDSPHSEASNNKQ